MRALPSPTTSPRTSDPSALALALPILAGLLTFAAILLTTFESNAALRVSAVWFAGGVGIGVLYLSDTRRWPAFLAALALGALLAFVLQGLPFKWVVASVAIGLVVSAATAALLKAWLPAQQALESPSSVLLLLGIGALGSALLSALLGAGALSLLSPAGGSGSFSTNFRVWAIANLTGSALVLPLVVAWAQFRARRSGGLALVPFAAGASTALLALASTLFVFVGPTAERFSGSVGATLVYLPFAFLALTALCWGVRGATLLNFAVALIAIFCTARGSGPFAAVEGFAGEALQEVQGYVLASSLLSVLICALGAAQRRAQREADALRVRQRSVLDALEASLYELDPFTGLLQRDGGAALAPAGASELADWLGLVDRDARAAVSARFERLMQGRATAADLTMRYAVRDRAGGAPRWIEDEARTLEDERGRVYRVVGTMRAVATA